MKNRRFLFLLLQPALILAISPPILSGDRERAAASQPSIAGCNVFPANNIWNTRIDTAPVDPNSAAYVQTIGAATGVHPDFGSGLYEGGPIGIPFIVVPPTQPKIPIQFLAFAGESDPGPYPVPLDAPIENGPSSTGDRHVLVLETGSCKLYELYNAYPAVDKWRADSGAVFDLNSNQLRPAGWTSSDAAGFAIVPGLVRYDEVAAGEIRHALRFTVPKTRRAYVWPATHPASSLTGTQYPPMGQRFRLRAGFDESTLSREAQVIARALKLYGMMIADNGQSWFITGAPDERWNNDRLRDLNKIKGSDFEAVDQSGLMLDPTSAAARQPMRVTNAGSLAEGPVSPGEIVTIFGSGLGSEFSVDGVAATVLYSSSTQMNAILPAKLGSTAHLVISGAGGGAMDIPVSDATPAIFTIPSGGTGQGAILNEDSSINGVAAPAARGTVVQIFGTGGGSMQTKASVEIGGKAAEVTYSGFAPEQVPGLIQINAVVPQTVPSGDVPIVIQIGTARSPSGVTLAVR